MNRPCMLCLVELPNRTVEKLIPKPIAYDGALVDVFHDGEWYMDREIVEIIGTVDASVDDYIAAITNIK